MYQPACELPARGYFVRPTLFTNVSQSSRIAREEIFGPVLSVITFRTPEEAIEKANNTAYGLSAGVWTEKGSRILAMASRLRAGVVWANTFNRFDPTSPFGGYKELGFGREGGLHGLLAYMDLGRVTESTPDARLDVRKTYKLYIGGQFPRSELGRSYVVRAAGRHAARQCGPWLPQGRPRRRPDRPRRSPRLVGQDRHEPGPGPVSRGGAAGRSPRPGRRRGRAAPRAWTRGHPGSRSTGRSTASSGMPAGRTS